VNFVPPTLDGDRVLWLGDAPGDSDTSQRAPLVGQGGALLRRVAKEQNVPEPWSFSNLVHCQPPSALATGAREATCCLAEFTLAEAQQHRFVVLLGNAPLAAFFPRANATHFRGNVAWHPDFSYTRFFTMHHPGAVLRNPKLEGEFQQQVNRFARIVRGEDAPTYSIVRGGAAAELLRAMVEEPVLSIDFETTQLESFTVTSAVKSLAVTTLAADRVVVAHRDEPHFRAMLQMLATFVADSSKSVIGAHVSFDLEWLEREFDIRVACELIHDVGIQWYQAGQYKMPSLKELVSRELDGYRWLVHEPHTVRDVELLLRYGAEDVVHPVHLMRKAMRLMKPRTRDLAVRVLGPADLILQRMSTTGFMLRDDYRQAKIIEYSDRRRALIEAWHAADPEFIPSVHESGNGLIQYLYEVKKLPVLERTESELPATDRAVLKRLERSGYAAIVKPVMELKEIDKIESTYLTAYNKHVWPDGRVRASYPLTWTDSGRTSSRAPNLQNVPRLQEIRDLFGAALGAVLLESDLSQIEFRIMVCLAQDANGIAGYLRGDDAHTMTARMLTGNLTPTKEQRTLAKPVNFGCLYGGGWRMVQQYAANEYGVDWSDAETQTFISAFMATYPSIAQLHERSRRELFDNKGWQESAVGHVFHYVQWNNRDEGKRQHAERAALNARAQGPAAQLCLYIMVLARRLLDARGFQSVQFVNYVHDSIVSEIPNPAWVPDVVAIIDEATQDARKWVRDWFVVPLVMEHKVGESWGSLTDL
jgi:DNA polymerase-1